MSLVEAGESFPLVTHREETGRELPLPNVTLALQGQCGAARATGRWERLSPLPG